MTKPRTQRPPKPRSVKLKGGRHIANIKAKNDEMSESELFGALGRAERRGYTDLIICLKGNSLTIDLTR